MLYEYIESSKWLQEKANFIHNSLIEHCSDIDCKFANGVPEIYVNRDGSCINFIVEYDDPYDEGFEESFSYPITSDILYGSIEDIVLWYQEDIKKKELEFNKERLNNFIYEMSENNIYIDEILRIIEECGISDDDLLKYNVRNDIVEELLNIDATDGDVK